MGNTLVAIKEGATVVDGTLGGIGAEVASKAI